MKRFFERAPNRHRLADAFHLSIKGRVGLRKFFESEPRDFGHDVINRRLEAGRGFAGDIVLDFIQQIANRQFGRDFGNRKTRGFRSQRGGARYARVHLNDHHAPILRVDGELDIRAARFHPHCPDDRERCIAHDLEFLIG